MTISLTQEQENRVRQKIATGRYGSPSDVIHEALRLIDERDQTEALCKADLDRKIAIGLAALRAGEGHDGEAVFERINAELDAIELHSSS